MRAIIALCMGLVACGGYQSINPGMTTEQASKEMSGWPSTRIEPFNDGYSATYYNNDTCILFKDDRVVAKDQATEQRNAIALGGGGIGAVTVCHALCVPPGVPRQRECESSAFGVAPRR